MRIFAAIADRILQGLIPASVARQQMMFTNTWLADVEADHDQWEPDELWAALQRHPAGGDSPSPARGSAPTSDLPPVLKLVQPAAATTPQAGVSSSGGRHSKPQDDPDQQWIDDLVEDYRQFITESVINKFRK